MANTKFGIMISTGNGPYRWIAGGWDALYTTRREAEDAQARAQRMEGWSAKVIEVTPPALHDYQTGAYLRDASEAELDASRSASLTDGGCGVISVDGRSCYVVE